MVGSPGVKVAPLPALGRGRGFHIYERMEGMGWPELDNKIKKKRAGNFSRLLRKMGIGLLEGCDSQRVPKANQENGRTGHKAMLPRGPRQPPTHQVPSLPGK